MTISSTTWKTVLDGPAAEAAALAIDAVTRDLLAAPPGVGRGADDPLVAVLFAELGRARGHERLGRAALERLDAAGERLSHDNVTPALYGGFCAVAWLAAWLPKALPSLASPVGAEDPCEEVDASLAESLDGQEWTSYDLISGLVGVGVYALERLPSPVGVALAEGVLGQLERSARHEASGITWFTPPDRLPPHQRVEAPAGYYNLGVAHGVPGVVAWLGHLCRAGVAVDRARRLLDGAVSWVLGQTLESGAGAGFPSWNAPGQPRKEARRAAWCYGGLGVSAALMLAARAVENKHWEGEAVRLALREGRRGGAGVRDASLCHGSAGNGLIFHRFYEVTGEERFRDLASRWYQDALIRRQPGQGYGGYRFWKAVDPKDPLGTMGDVDDMSFLSGSAGVALGLLAALGSVEPSWDRLLLTDIERRA